MECFDTPALLSQKVSILESFRKTEEFFYKLLRYCATKKHSLKNCDTTPTFFPIFFWLRVFSETQRGSPTNFFGAVRQKRLEQNSWYNLLLSKEIFDTGVFLKNRKLPPHKVLGSVLMKRIDGNFWYSLVLIHRQKRYRKIFEVQKASSTKRSVLWDRNCSTEILNTPSLLSIKSFDVGKILEDRRVPLQAF